MPCVILPRHEHREPPAGWPVQATLLAMESQIVERTIARRKRRVLAEPEARVKRELARAFRSEGGRVLDLLRVYRLPYAPKIKSMAETVAEGETLTVYHTAKEPIGQFGGGHAAGHQIQGIYFSTRSQDLWGTATGRPYSHEVELKDVKLADRKTAMDVYLDEMGKGKDYGRITTERLISMGYDGARLSDNEIVLFNPSKTFIKKVSKRVPWTGKITEPAIPSATFNDPGLRAVMNYLLNGQSISPYESALDGFYRDVFPKAMDAATAEAMAAAGVGIHGTLGRFPGAEQWIKENAIRFGRRYAPKVTEATNAAIRSQLARGWSQFEGIDQLMARVRKVYTDCSVYRSETIARTEGNRAYSAASHEAYDQLGADGHYWIISGSEYAVWPEICAVNASLGTIPMSQQFEDSDGGDIDAPPAHPNCLCDEGIDFSDSWLAPEWVNGE